MIRSAVAEDAPAILELIRELARYEREPDAVQADEASLHTALFGPAPAVYALVAEHGDGSVVGCAIWFVNFSTWTGRHGVYLEDLVVDEGHRRCGYGRQLLAELARICVERGYGRLEWSVLDWNEPALKFYASLGAEPMSAWTVHRVSGSTLTALAGASPDR
ncbi:N-acetyltransferase family protein [Jatrophihabitans sp. DSM 45814]